MPAPSDRVRSGNLYGASPSGRIPKSRYTDRGSTPESRPSFSYQGGVAFPRAKTRSKATSTSNSTFASGSHQRSRPGTAPVGQNPWRPSVPGSSRGRSGVPSSNGGTHPPPRERAPDSRWTESLTRGAVAKMFQPTDWLPPFQNTPTEWSMPSNCHSFAPPDEEAWDGEDGRGENRGGRGGGGGARGGGGSRACTPLAGSVPSLGRTRWGGGGDGDNGRGGVVSGDGDSACPASDSAPPPSFNIFAATRGGGAATTSSRPPSRSPSTTIKNEKVAAARRDQEKRYQALLAFQRQAKGEPSEKMLERQRKKQAKKDKDEAMARRKKKEEEDEGKRHEKEGANFNATLDPIRAVFRLLDTDRSNTLEQVRHNNKLTLTVRVCFGCGWVWVSVWMCGWIEVGFGEGYESETKVRCVRGWLGMRRNGCIRRLHKERIADVTLTIILNTIHLGSPFCPVVSLCLHPAPFSSVNYWSLSRTPLVCEQCLPSPRNCTLW